MTYTAPTAKTVNTIMLVLARHLVNELSYRNYPDEWLHPPLQSLLPHFYNILNHHPERIGAVLEQSINSGKINQLRHEYPQLFKPTRQYYLDEYTVKERGLQGYWNGRPERPEILPRSELRTAAEALIQLFSILHIEQENEHRTLENISYPFALLLDACGEYDAAFDTEEYADQWRNLTAIERERLSSDILERWK